MAMDQERRKSIFAQAKSFFEAQNGFPAQWQEEISELSAEDIFDELDILIAHMCTPEWGGIQAVRSFLATLGVAEEDAETLIADNCDFVF